MVNLTELPEDVIEKLKPLSFDGFKSLAIEAGAMRHEDNLKALPSEPDTAIKGALHEMNMQVSLEVEAVEFVAAVLDVVTTAADNLDSDELGKAIATLTNTSLHVLMKHKEQLNEARLILRAGMA